MKGIEKYILKLRWHDRSNPMYMDCKVESAFNAKKGFWNKYWSIRPHEEYMSAFQNTTKLAKNAELSLEIKIPEILEDPKALLQYWI